MKLPDSQANLLVKGPHPKELDRDVLHWFEMCDAVQAQAYKIDGVDVSRIAAARMAMKSKLGAARRSQRYRMSTHEREKVRAEARKWRG